MKNINPEWVKERLARIEKVAGDDEVAHAKERLLWHNVLSYIARDMADDPKQCAALAITSLKFDFARYTA